MAGLAAAWRLSEAGWTERFSSITVLERGFRLGGKGASSRGPHGRIEEHGLHVWLGHYDNAFRVMRDCYAEPTKNGPIRTARSAPGATPSSRPGSLGSSTGPGWLGALGESSRATASCPATRAPTDDPPIAELLLRSAADPRLLRLARLQGDAGSPGHDGHLPLTPHRAAGERRLPCLASTLLAVTQQLLLLGSRETRRLAGPRGAAVIDAAFAPLLARLAPAVRTDLGRAASDLVDLVRCVLRGMAADGLRGDRDAYDAIDHLEFRDWLARHGAQPSTLQSALVRGQYDLGFSNKDGDPSRPTVAAGWGVFLSYKLWFDYKGAIFWKMRGGMGEAVFAPLYQALVARGVRFRFLTQVEELVPAADGSAIRSVVCRQAGLAPGVREYRPLVAVKGGSCFPSAPDLRQLGTGPSPCSTRSYAAVRTSTCSSLPSRRPWAGSSAADWPLSGDWRAMLDRIGTVATHAFQVWLKPDERALAGHIPAPR